MIAIDLSLSDAIDDFFNESQIAAVEISQHHRVAGQHLKPGLFSICLK
jgi:hypothetical protein